MRQQNEKGELDSFINRWMSWTSVETALFSFSLSLAALCLWLNCMDVRTCPKPSMQQEQQPSPQYQSINQSSLAIAYPFSVSLTFTRTVSIRDWTRKKLSTVSRMKKGCPTAPSPDRQWRDIFGLVIKQLTLSAPFTCLCKCLQGF